MPVIIYTRPEGRGRSPRSLLVAIIVIVVIVVADRAQEVAEDPLRHVPTLFPRLHVCRTEVDAFPDARIHHVMSHIREPVIVKRLHWRRGVCGVQSEVHFVGAEEEREAAGRGAGDIVGSRSVLGIVRVVDEWLPIWVADGVRVAIVVAFLNGSEGTPGNEVALAVPSSNDRISYRQIDQREETRAVIDAGETGVRDISRHLVVVREEIGIEEQGQVGLVRGASTVEARTQGLDFVIGRSISLACQGRRRHRTKLGRALQGKRSDRREPWRQHWRKRRRRSRLKRRSWPPLAGSVATRERWRWGRWKAAVVGPQGNDASRSRGTNGDTKIAFRETVCGQIVVKGRVESPGERGKSIDEHVVSGLGDSGGCRAGGTWDVYGERSEPARDRLNGVINGGLDHRAVKGPGRAGMDGRAAARRGGTRRVGDYLYGDRIPIRYGVGSYD